MKNEPTPETPTIEQAEEKISDLLAREISVVKHGSPQHKKLKLAQAVVNALDQMKMDIDLIQAKPVLNPKKFISGGFIGRKTRNNLTP